MLSHAFKGVVQVYPSSWCWDWLVSLVRVGLPSVEMWFDRGEDRCYGLSRVVMVETVGFCLVMWFVMLESAMDRPLRVDTPGQLVSPRVRYGMAGLLIRDVVGCVLCSVKWGWLLALWPVFVTFFVNCMNHMVQEGPLCVGNLSTASGDCLSGNRSKAWHSPVVDLCNGM
jgi:hypothetical protein